MSFWVLVFLCVFAAIACGGFGYNANQSAHMPSPASLGWFLAGAGLVILALLLLIGRLVWWISKIKPFGAIAAMAVAGAVLFAAHAPEARAADQRPLSVEECIAFADLAVVAAAAAKHGVERARLEAMLPEIYNVAQPGPAAVAAGVVAKAYAAPPADPGAFAVDFGRRCIAAGGKLDTVLGTAL